MDFLRVAYKECKCEVKVWGCGERVNVCGEEFEARMCACFCQCFSSSLYFNSMIDRLSGTGWG